MSQKGAPWGGGGPREWAEPGGTVGGWDADLPLRNRRRACGLLCAPGWAVSLSERCQEVAGEPDRAAAGRFRGEFRLLHSARPALPGVVFLSPPLDFVSRGREGPRRRRRGRTCSRGGPSPGNRGQGGAGRPGCPAAERSRVRRLLGPGATGEAAGVPRVGSVSGSGSVCRRSARAAQRWGPVLCPHPLSPRCAPQAGSEALGSASPPPVPEARGASVSPLALLTGPPTGSGNS